MLLKTQQIKRQDYKGVLVTSMARALRSREINKHLNLEDKNKISSIWNTYKTKGFIDGTAMNTLYLYYNNFVIMGFRY